jgi:hypothetical protein
MSKKRIGDGKLCIGKRNGYACPKVNDFVGAPLAAPWRTGRRGDELHPLAKGDSRGI